MLTNNDQLTEAVRISLKGTSIPKFLAPALWSFDSLQEYLQTLCSSSTLPLLYRNHQLFGEASATSLKDHLGETFDCHFIEDKKVFRLKLEKVLFVPQETFLPLLLTSL